MSTEQKDVYFFKFLAEVLPVEGETYRTNFNIWAHSIEWVSHKCHRAGYIFMGNPGNRSTTHPQQHFYIYFMPIFTTSNMGRGAEKDSVYFILDELSDEFKQKVALFGSALSQEGSASSDEKPKYKLLRDKYYKEAKNLFNEQFLDNIKVEYLGVSHPLKTMQGVHGDSKIDIVSNVTSVIMEQQFEAENPSYPKFTTLNQPLTKENWDNMLRSARSKIANQSVLNRNGEAILMGLGLWEDGRLSTENSQYARSLKQKLEAKGGQVLNRGEILELFFAETNEYISNDFHIEAELQMLVMGTMAALGEIEIVLSGGTHINAGNIAIMNNLQSQDNYNFTHICPPKGINIPLIRELMLGLLGVDRTAELDNSDSSVFADLMSKAKLIEDRVVSLQRKINGGYQFAGDIEIYSGVEAVTLNNEFDRLKGMANQMQRYNSKAKMRNIDWDSNIVHKTMTDTLHKFEETERRLEQLKEYEAYISYLRTALSNIDDANLHNEICKALDRVKEVIGEDESKQNEFKAELESLKNKYADWYMGEYTKAHIREMDYQKLEKIKSSEKFSTCSLISNVSFINPAQFNSLKQKFDALKLANSKVTKASILAVPTSIDGFNPTIQRGSLPNVESLEEELDDIYDGYIQQIKDTLSDPATNDNRELMGDDEKALIQQFEDDKLVLNVKNITSLIGVVNKLQRDFHKIEIGHDDMLRIFPRPMTKLQAIVALTEYIESLRNGHREEDIRIIVK